MSSNSIAFARNYVSVIDEVYQRAAVSGVLNSGRRMVRAGHNAREIMIPKISVTGLGDYTRNVGYKTGAITYEFETKTFNYDRGIRLFADVMDDDESGYAEASDLPPTVWYGTSMPGPTEGDTSYYSDVTYKDVRLGDLLLNTSRGNLSQCVFSNGTGGMNCTGILQLAKFRGIVTTTSLDLAAGATGSGSVDSLGHSVCTGTLILNTATGALMRATSTGNPASAGAATVTVNAVGLGNVFSGGTSLSASSPLSIANDTIS